MVIIKNLRTLLLFAALIGWGSNVLTQSPLFVDQFVAKVNSEVILSSEIQLEIAIDETPLSSEKIKIKNLSIRQVIDRIINERLLLGEARRFIFIRPDKVDSEVLEISDRVGGLNELRAILDGIGMSFEEYNQRIRNQMMLREYIQSRIRSFIQVQQKEVDEYLIATLPELSQDLIKSQNKDLEALENLRNIASKYLQELEVNRRIEETVKRLRQASEIEYLIEEDAAPSKM